MSELIGVLNLNKPAGITSRRAIDHVARLVRPLKVGHAGTLDPLATGVLVTCLGQATRLIEYIQDLPKQYRATFLLGKTSTTEDIEGEVTDLADAPRPTLKAIRAAADGMIGEVLQRPPAFSALKVQGKRAYALARQGHDVALAARPIMIHRIEVVEYANPELRLEIECGSGTYIRSIGRDLAESLGTGAIMAALERTAIGPFQIGDAIDPRQLDRGAIERKMVPAARAVSHLPVIELTQQQVTALRYGQALRGVDCEFQGPLAGLDESGRLVAILRKSAADEFRSERFFPVTQA